MGERLARLRGIVLAQRHFDVRLQTRHGRAHLVRRVGDEPALVAQDLIEPRHQVVDGGQQRMHLAGDVFHGDGAEVEMRARGDGLPQIAQRREPARHACPQHAPGDDDQQQLGHDDADHDLVRERMPLDERLGDLHDHRAARRRRRRDSCATRTGSPWNSLS